MEKVMLELDSTLLLSLALGWPCVVWDYGSRNRKNVPLEGVPRAAWYGVEFIRYCLDKLWWESEASTPPPILRGHNVAREFDEKIQRFDKSTKKRIRYYRRWISRGSPPGVLLCAACKSTSNDGDYGYYRDLLQSRYSPMDVTEISPSDRIRACHAQPLPDFVAEAGYSLFTGGCNVSRIME